MSKEQQARTDQENINTGFSNRGAVSNERHDKSKASSARDDDGKRHHQGRPKGFIARWKATTIGNQIIIVATVVVALANLGYVVVASIQLREMKAGSADTKAIAAA